MKSIIVALTVFDRVVIIPDILPQQAGYESGIVIRDLRKKTRLSQEEIVRLSFRSDPDKSDPNKIRMNWNTAKDKPKPFELTELEHGILQRNLARMDKEEKLGTDDRWIGFYDKVMNAKKEDRKRKS